VGSQKASILLLYLCFFAPFSWLVFFVSASFAHGLLALFFSMVILLYRGMSSYFWPFVWLPDEYAKSRASLTRRALLGEAERHRPQCGFLGYFNFLYAFPFRCTSRPRL